MKSLILFLLMMSSFSYAQTRDELIQEYMKERSKMMGEIMKMFQDDGLLGDDFFKEDMHPFDNIERLKKLRGDNVTIEEKNEKDGTISITITPKNKDIDLDISTENNRITIKTETKVKESVDEEGNSFTSMSSSKSTRSISIPEGFEAMPPKQLGEGILISLKPKSQKIKKVYKDRVPVKKRPGEMTI